LTSPLFPSPRVNLLRDAWQRNPICALWHGPMIASVKEYFALPHSCPVGSMRCNYSARLGFLVGSAIFLRPASPPHGLVCVGTCARNDGSLWRIARASCLAHLNCVVLSLFARLGFWRVGRVDSRRRTDPHPSKHLHVCIWVHHL
jgi:hypothetical protein